MLAAEEMRRKIYKLADDFEVYYREKKFFQAKAAYDETNEHFHYPGEKVTWR